MVPGKQGFFSGMIATDAVLADPPRFQVRINDTEPIFYYCSAPGSCIDWQMVGVINPVRNALNLRSCPDILECHRISFDGGTVKTPLSHPASV